MNDIKGIEYLRRKLIYKKQRVNIRYEYYEMKNYVKDLNISTPPELRWLNEVLGWCAKGVDSLADRLVFREFRDDNLGLSEIFQLNNQDILSDSAVLSALISSCCFVYIAVNDDGYPRLEVIDGGNATGQIDTTTMLLTEGYAVLQRDPDTNEIVREAYFLPYETQYYYRGQLERKFTHNVPYPLLVPIINRPDNMRKFGHSRISRTCMSLQNSAIRTIKRSEITAEFYSFPQKYVTGLSEEAEIVDKWKSAISTMLMFTKDSEGDHPSVGQFTQQSMAPHIEQLKMFASAFAGETGLTLDDLGFPQSNPSSVEAIKAAHENLRLTGRKAQRSFGTGFLNVGYLGACLRDEHEYKREILYLTKPIWEPIFEPDASMLSGIGDAVLKINQAIPDYIDNEKLKDMTGF